MPMNELEMFLSAWDREAESTLKLLRALPAGMYHWLLKVQRRLSGATRCVSPPTT